MGDQFGRPQRLYHELIHAGSKRGPSVPVGMASSQHDEVKFARRAFATQHSADFDAVDSRQVPVAHDERRRRLTKPVNRFESVVGRDHVVPLFLEEPRHQPTLNGIVVNY